MKKKRCQAGDRKADLTMFGKLELVAALQSVVEEANGGVWPCRLRHWRQVGRRFNHRIDWMDPDWGMDAHAAGSVVYINRWQTRPLAARRKQLETELRHEMIETACMYEGVPPFCYPAQWGDHHALTVELERTFDEQVSLDEQMANFLLHEDEIKGQLGPYDAQMLGSAGCRF